MAKKHRLRAFLPDPKHPSVFFKIEVGSDISDPEEQHSSVHDSDDSVSWLNDCPSSVCSLYASKCYVQYLDSTHSQNLYLAQMDNVVTEILIGKKNKHVGLMMGPACSDMM